MKQLCIRAGQRARVGIYSLAGLVLALGCLSASATPAQAGVVYGKMSLKLSSWGPHGPSGGPNVTLYSATSGGSVVAGNVPVHNGGGFLWSNVAYTPITRDFDFYDPPPINNATTLLTFCLELTEHIGFGGNYTVDVVPLSDAPNPGPPAGMGGTSAELISTLFYNFFDDVMNETNAAQQAIKAGAFQLAIWKLEYDHGMITNLSTGFLRVASGASTTNSNAVVSLAQTWIAQTIIDKNLNLGHRAELVALSARNFQDQVTLVLASPEPASIAVWLGVAGFGGAMRVRRRRRENSSVVA